MEKKKVAIVTLGDSRREFYKKREAIVASEIEKVKKAFGDKYDLYISPIVFDTEDGQNISVGECCKGKGSGSDADKAVYSPQLLRSRFRYPIASARWMFRIFSLLSRSAMVRATLSILS